MLVIEKFPGANTLEVTRGVEEALAALAPGLGGHRSRHDRLPAGDLHRGRDRQRLARAAAGFLLDRRSVPASSATGEPRDRRRRHVPAVARGCAARRSTSSGRRSTRWSSPAWSSRSVSSSTTRSSASTTILRRVSATPQDSDGGATRAASIDCSQAVRRSRRALAVRDGHRPSPRSRRCPSSAVPAGAFVPPLVISYPAGVARLDRRRADRHAGAPCVLLSRAPREQQPTPAIATARPTATRRSVRHAPADAAVLRRRRGIRVRRLLVVGWAGTCRSLGDPVVPPFKERRPAHPLGWRARHVAASR